MRLMLSSMVLLALIGGCAPAGRYSEPGTDYYADMEYSNIDKRWYHKNSPASRDIQPYDSSAPRD